MRIGITTMGCDAGRSGMSTYVLRLLEHLQRLQGPGPFELIALEEEVLIWTTGLRMETVRVSNRFRRALPNVAWHQLFLPGLCRRRSYDLLLLPAANRRVPLRLTCPTVGVVHDFSHLHIPGKYDAARTLYQSRVLPRMVARLDHVITISESSKRDIVEHARVAEERITVIPHGVDHEVYRPATDRAPEPPLLAGLRSGVPYVLYVSRLEHPAKNHIRLIQAFDRLKSREDLPHQLVLAGGDWHGSQEIHAMASASAHRKDIVLLGFAPTSTLPDLYRAASLFAFPSLCEGFGLPILEAMACGVPVTCSNVSSMPEVAGDAALLFDPLSVDEIEQSLEIGLLNEDRRRELRALGLRRAGQFTWEETARRTWATLLSAAGSTSSPS